MFPVYGVEDAPPRFRKTSFKKRKYHSPLEGESQKPSRSGEG